MNSFVGHAGVLLGFLSALGGVVVGVRRLLSGNNDAHNKMSVFVWTMLAGACLGVLAMQNALLSHDFSLQFVAQNNSRETPLLFTIAGMWSALEGSILLWALVLCGYIALGVKVFAKRRQDPVVGWALVVCCLVAAFFFGLMVGPADPFKTLSEIPADGRGPNPLLQNHPLMALHPPLLYLGYVGFTVPFSFAVAALITGRLDEKWLAVTRRWSLAAWGFLTVGILMGAWWSYEVLGWGGYWAWDPVENASLLPWLTATAYLHSVMVQERRAMLRIWNIALITATFSLTILGTFFTRSGVLDSVHAFTESAIGPTLLAFFGVVVVSACGLVFWRGSALSSPGSIKSPLSRESAFLANNAVFAVLTFVVLLGTVFPLLAEVFQGERVAVGRPFFDSMVRPLGLVLLFLMAVGTVLPWRGASTDVVGNRLLVPTAVSVAVTAISVASGARGLWVVIAILLASLVVATSLREVALSVKANGWVALLGRKTGAMVCHIALAVLAFGLIGSNAATTRTELAMRPGDVVYVGGHKIAFERLEDQRFANRESTFARVVVDDATTRSPALSVYKNASQAVGTPSVMSGFKEDVYLTLVRVPENRADPVAISVIVMPMVSWLWASGGIFTLGIVLCLLPRNLSRRRQPDPPVDIAEAERSEAVRFDAGRDNV